MMISRLIRSLGIGIALFTLLAVFAQGQKRSKPTAAPAAPEKTAAVASGLAIDDIVKMSKAGLGEGIIVQQIRKNGRAFDLTPDQMIQLKVASVSDRVISVMMDPSAPDAVTPPVVAAPVVQAAEELSLKEIGVYAKKKGEWIEVLPEIVNFKTGGVFKSIASGGIVKGDINGHVEGPSSRTGLTTPVEIRIVLPEGVSITEYQLIRLHQNLCDSGQGNGTNLKNSMMDCGNREFRTVTGGVMHVKGGATRDALAFEGKRIGGRAYSVAFSSDLTVGEYGFLPPSLLGGGSNGAGKIYSFRVIE